MIADVDGTITITAEEAWAAATEFNEQLAALNIRVKALGADLDGRCRRAGSELG
jgi:hypothetical protein